MKGAPMDWKKLLSTRRINANGQLRDAPPEEARTAFERDWDRVLFSGAFRRMHDKTQVFPLPEDDVTHSRLTHSLEVASVGRQLGRWIGNAVCKREDIGATPHDIATLVATGCLAHDIGNPPFGHAGEDAIGSYFRSSAGQEVLKGLNEKETFDLERFEGNAQGFRILTRTQLEPDGGLQLCAATLGAFSKYPRGAGSDLENTSIAATNKHGFTQSEEGIFRKVAEELQLEQICPGRSWHRHPLALLVEAADDICYSILDIEDGVRLGHVPEQEATEILRALASKHPSFNEERYKDKPTKSKIGYLRALSIGQLVTECATKFLDLEHEILGGRFTKSLVAVVTSAADLKALVKLARRRCYDAPTVVEIEMAGYEALGGLLSHFVPAVASQPDAREGLSKQRRKTLVLLAGRGVNVSEGGRYERILRVTDHVSGMTDRHALATYRKLHGISVPGRFA